MSIEKEMTLNDYINIIKRRFPYVLGFFFFVFLAAFAVALKLPPVYESTGTILFETQQVQSDTAREKYATDRFAALKQVVLSNDNLYKIAKQYKLYGLDKKPNLSPERLAQILRANIKVDLLKAEAEGWGEKPTFAFNVTFTNYKADNTYNIANDLVKLFLDENERASKERATETTEFFSKEAEKQKIALERIEKEVTAYKRLHANSLPENKALKVVSLERLENDLRVTQREYSATQAELRSLDVSLESAKAGIGVGTPSDPSSGASEVEKLKSELAKMSAIYSENHPSVRALQRRVEALEKNATHNAEPAKRVTAQSVMVDKVQAQIETANARLKALEIEEAGIRAKISQTEGLVMQSAQTEGTLGALLRDYDNAKAAYAEIKAKLDNSRLAKNIELENKGERFVLTEAPTFPDKPIKPNRLLIILAGFLGAIAAAIGLAVVMEALDKRVRGVDMLASIMKIQPMATIPYITNKAELKRKKYIVFNILVGVLIIALLALFLIHIFFMPLDELTTKILSRF
ncbi:MAG TPA: lipopolysaccharide biosynthesis protein [Methylotenera sp.]|nr:lipopolysaccharide biosynthesis protein [Methylotenera sp.]